MNTTNQKISNLSFNQDYQYTYDYEDYYSYILESFKKTFSNSKPAVIIFGIEFCVETYVLLSLVCYCIINFTKPPGNLRKNAPRRNHIILIVLLLLMVLFGIITNIVLLLKMIQIINLTTFNKATYMQIKYSGVAEGTIYDVFFPAGLLCHFSFLWMRQHILYSEPSMKSLVSKHMVRFSNAIIFLIGIFGIAMVTVYVKLFYKLGILVSSFLSFFYQTSILFCFCYILRRHQAEMSRFAPESTRSRVTSPTSLNKLIRSCSIATGIGLTSDFVTVIVNVWAYTSTSMSFNILQLIFLSVAQTDFLINLFCDIFCFSNWKRILFPWIYWREVCKIKKSNEVKN